MRVPKHPTLIKQMLKSRVTKLKAQGPVLSASLVQSGKQCGRPGCRCMEGERHIQNQITFKVKGKTQTVYVPRDLVEEVGEWIEEHKRLRNLTQEISQLAVALVRTHVTAKKRKAGRR